MSPEPVDVGRFEGVGRDGLADLGETARTAAHWPGVIVVGEVASADGFGQREDS